MTPETVQTSLRFVGDWPWWAGCGGALVLGVSAWLLYRRELHSASWWQRFLLPGLRALVVMMIVLMLSGPVLHHRKVIGELSRLLLFVDGSKSMGLTDQSMDAGRKILILQRLGLWRSDYVKMDLPQAAEALAAAQTIAGKGRDMASASGDEWSKLTHEFEEKINAAKDAMSRGGLEPDRQDAFLRELGVSASKCGSPTACRSLPAPNSTNSTATKTPDGIASRRT